MPGTSQSGEMCVGERVQSDCPLEYACSHLQGNINNKLCDRSSALLLPFSWERLQGSISQPAITCSQKRHLATYLWSSCCPFNAIQQLLTTVAAVSLPRATKMRVFVCLNARWLSHSTKCNDWVWSLTLNRVAE